METRTARPGATGCHPWGVGGGGGAQVSGSPYLPGSSSSPASPEPGARASVCKQTGHVAAGTRSPPLAPQEPSGSPLGTATAPHQPSRAARSAGAGPSPGRTARTGAESVPRPREPSSRSPQYLAVGCPVRLAPGSAAPECLARKDCPADSSAPSALLKPQSPPPPPPLLLRIPPSGLGACPVTDAPPRLSHRLST